MVCGVSTSFSVYFGDEAFSALKSFSTAPTTLTSFRVCCEEGAAWPAGSAALAASAAWAATGRSITASAAPICWLKRDDTCLRLLIAIFLLSMILRSPGWRCKTMPEHEGQMAGDGKNGRHCNNR